MIYKTVTVNSCSTEMLKTLLQLPRHTHTCTHSHALPLCLKMPYLARWESLTSLVTSNYARGLTAVATATHRIGKLHWDSGRMCAGATARSPAQRKLYGTDITDSVSLCFSSSSTAVVVDPCRRTSTQPRSARGDEIAGNVCWRWT